MNNRVIGDFTTYDVEYIYDFLGKERINESIKLSKINKTGSMGRSLESFLNNNNSFSPIGPLSIFQMFIDNYFSNDIELAFYLFEKSKEYNEQNYYNTKNLCQKWTEHLIRIEQQIAFNQKRNVEDRNEPAFYDELKRNKYWVEFHFFYQILIKLIVRNVNVKTETRIYEIGECYIKNVDSISNYFKSEYRFVKCFTNAVLFDLYQFYENRGDTNQMLKISSICEKHEDVWFYRWKGK